MEKVWFVSVAAVLAAVTSCGSQTSDKPAAPASAESAQAPGSEPAPVAPSVQPQDVTPGDLQAAVSDKRVRQFYEGRDWRPAWTAQDTPGLLDALRGADRHGLDPASYLDPYERAGTPAAREAALTRAALDLGGVLADGKLNPASLYKIYTLPRPKMDLVAGLENAVAQGDPGKWLDSLAPQDPQYRALSQAYLDYARRAAEDARQPIGSGEVIHAGESDPRVPAIVERLRDNGYLDTDTAEKGELYTQDVADAVERLQQDAGIATDGIVGPVTLKVLNTGPADRARTLAINLERLRWLRRDPPKTRIDVNTAAATFRYFRDGTLRDERRVIVGKPSTTTPHLQTTMFRIVANPTWTVPRSIQYNEMPANKTAYMRKHNMVWRNGWIVQLPGPDNALGEVKFDLQNSHSVFLHDTPGKAAFQREDRHLSHGCVRVDKALELARLLAEDEGVLPQYETAQASGRETYVNLPKSIPVRLFYQTAFVDSAGEVTFRPDAYGWDDLVGRSLGL